MVLAAIPSQASSGQRRACSTTSIEIDCTALMHCPSALPAPFLMGHYYVLNAIFHALHTFKTLLDLKREVKVRSVGVSNYAVEDYKELLSAGISNEDKAVVHDYFQSEGVVMQSYRSLRDGKAMGNQTLISLGEDEMATLNALAKSVPSNVSLVCTRRRNAEDLKIER